MITEKVIVKLYEKLIATQFNTELKYFESWELDKIIMEHTNRKHNNSIHCQTKKLVLQRFKEVNGYEMIITSVTVQTDLKELATKKIYFFFPELYYKDEAGKKKLNQIKDNLRAKYEHY